MDQFEKLSEGKWKNIDVDQGLEPEFLAETMKEWQDPNSADKLTKIQKNLDEIKDVMHKNIEEILKRGETLDSLMDKSQDLSASSKMFYHKAKDQNKCCKYAHACLFVFVYFVFACVEHSSEWLRHFALLLVFSAKSISTMHAATFNLNVIV